MLSRFAIAKHEVAPGINNGGRYVFQQNGSIDRLPADPQLFHVIREMQISVGAPRSRNFRSVSLIYSAGNTVRVLDRFRRQSF
jgi:hypothetical protein